MEGMEGHVSSSSRLMGKKGKGEGKIGGGGGDKSQGSRSHQAGTQERRQGKGKGNQKQPVPLLRTDGKKKDPTAKRRDMCGRQMNTLWEWGGEGFREREDVPGRMGRKPKRSRDRVRGGRQRMSFEIKKEC